MVDDVIYVFGGRGVDGKDLGDLAAFKVSSAYLFPILSFSPCAWLTAPINVFPLFRSTMVHVPEYGTFA